MSSSTGDKDPTDEPAPILVQTNQDHPPDDPDNHQDETADDDEKEDDDDHDDNHHHEDEKEDDEQQQQVRQWRLEQERQREAANQAFWQLLQRARTTKNTKTTTTTTTTTPTTFTTNTNTAPTRGNSRQQQQQHPRDYNPDRSVPNRVAMSNDPQFGAWERHTKGIGMKLLAKMGYTPGSGSRGASGNGMTSKRSPPNRNSSSSNTTTTSTITTQPLELAPPPPPPRIMTAPIQVKVRPANLGLGFGNFQEATKLHANRALEAQVRGNHADAPPVDLSTTASTTTSTTKRGSGQKSVSSTPAVPTMQELLEEQSWMRPPPLPPPPPREEGDGQRKSGSGLAPRPRKRSRRTVVPYTELLATSGNEPNLVIVDRRGPTITTTTTAAAAGQQQQQQPPLLAEELLHNVSLLLSTHETKLYSSHHFVTAAQQKMKSVQSDIDSIQERLKRGQERQSKLQQVLHLLDQFDELNVLLLVPPPQDREDGTRDRPGRTQSKRFEDENQTTRTLAKLMDRANDLVQQLAHIFTPEERQTLQFSTLMVPSLFGTLVQSCIETWRPLKDSIQSSEHWIQTILSTGLASVQNQDSHPSDKSAGLSLTKTMLIDHVIPHLQKAMESSRWDPVRDTLPALQLCESLLRIVHDVEQAVTTAGAVPEAANDDDDDDHGIFSSTRNDDERGSRNNDSDEDDDSRKPTLSDLCKKEIIQHSVYNKLMRAIAMYKPKLDDHTHRLVDRPDLWILPWLPHLDHPALLPALVAECKRRVRSAISLLQKSISDDGDFLAASMETLKPWRGVFKAETLQEMVSNSVTPRLSRLLSHVPISRDGTKQDFSGFHVAQQYHELGLLSYREFASLVEAFLCRWACTIHSWLTKLPGDAAKVVIEAYIPWKSKVFVHPGSSIQSDEDISRYFYGILLMTRAAADGKDGVLDDLRPLPISFRRILSRRIADEKQRARDDLIRMDTAGVVDGRTNGSAEARVRLARQGYYTPTFREVVADFCQQHGILFQPKLGGSSSKDGKQVFQFGKVPVYLDSNVVFAFLEGDWRPMELEAIADRAIKLDT